MTRNLPLRNLGIVAEAISSLYEFTNIVRSCILSKPEGRGFDSRWCHWNFFIDIILPAVLGPGLDSVSNRNEHQEYFLEGKGSRCVGLTSLPP